MKLENEPGFAVVQSPPRKSYNPFESDDEETDGFGNTNAYDIKSFEKSADSLTFHLDNTDLSWEEAILGQPHPILNRAFPADDANGEEDLFRKDTHLFTDKKTVTEYDLPDLMVCYKENGYHSIKDIGIDEGVPAHGKVWIKNRDNNHESKNLDPTGDLSLENEHRALPSSIEVMKSRSENHLERDGEDLERQHSGHQCGTDDSVKVGNEFEHDSSKKESKSCILQSSEDEAKIGVMVNVSREPQLSELSCIKEEKEGKGVSDEEHGKGNNVQAEESSTKLPIMGGTEIIAESSKNNTLSYNSKVDSGSIVLNFNSSSTKDQEEEEEDDDNEEEEQKPPETQTVSAEKTPETQTVSVDETAETRTMPVQKPPETQTMSAEKPPEIQTMPVEKPLETQAMPAEKAPIAQSMSRIDEEGPDTEKRVHGEKSFSADMPLPSSITYMGPNALCGSISLRSESSTGSTRSFAFPVLQAEWNSSPVRMAKAEQRNFRKHRGWVQSLMCCKF